MNASREHDHSMTGDHGSSARSEHVRRLVSDAPDQRTPEEIAADIERTRDRMERTLAALQRKLTPAGQDRHGAGRRRDGGAAGSLVTDGRASATIAVVARSRAEAHAESSGCDAQAQIIDEVRLRGGGTRPGGIGVVSGGRAFIDALSTGNVRCDGSVGKVGKFVAARRSNPFADSDFGGSPGGLDVADWPIRSAQTRHFLLAQPHIPAHSAGEGRC
jgi:hypothetical protein